MKTLTCAQMGGPCEDKISGETKDEMMANGMKHIEEKHPEMAASIKTMSPEDPKMVEWQKEFDKQWDAAPSA